MAYVACGRFDAYWQRELNYWDIAAGIVILKEAGGFIDFFDEDKNAPLKKNIIASLATLICQVAWHDKAQCTEYIRQVLLKLLEPFKEKITGLQNQQTKI